MIASITGIMGILVGVLQLTGFGLKLSQIILSLSQGNLFLTIMMVAITAFILGMGSPIAAVYVILAVIAPAAMIDLGVPMIAAHLLLIWYSQLSGLTPPVCLVSFAAAAIAKGDPFKTGLISMKYGFGLILIPLLFVYTPLLLTGTPLENVLAVLTALIAVTACCFFIQRHFLRKNTWIEQACFGVGALMLCLPQQKLMNAIGLGLVMIAVCFQAVFIFKRKTLNTVGH